MTRRNPRAGVGGVCSGDNKSGELDSTGEKDLDAINDTG